MINKPLNDIAEADIQALVTNAVPESRTLDYKETLPGGTDNDKREFLADVSSFANAMGGDLVYGMAEQRDTDGKPTGVPANIAALAANPDSEILRLESAVRDGLEPRVVGVAFRAVTVPGGTVLVLRVPRSWSAPHMVVFKNLSRFFSRGSAGKYQLDVTELRGAFVASDARASQVARFRDERVGRIVAGDTPVPLFDANRGRAVLHVVPVATLDPTFTVGLPALREVSVTIRPMGASDWNHRYNFDGLLTYTGQNAHSPSRAYFQLFRNGAVEALNSGFLGGANDELILPSFENDFIETLRNTLSLYAHMGIEPPLFVMASMVGVEGRTMSRPSSFSGPEGGVAVDRDVLLLPDVVIQDFGEDLPSALRPVNDAVWQAAGWPRSINYADDGTWSVRG